DGACRHRRGQGTVLRDDDARSTVLCRRVAAAGRRLRVWSRNRRLIGGGATAFRAAATPAAADAPRPAQPQPVERRGRHCLRSVAPGRLRRWCVSALVALIDDRGQTTISEIAVCPRLPLGVNRA